MDIIEAIRAHAQRESPKEACGLIVARGNKASIIEAVNIAESSQFEFEIAPEAWMQVADDQEVIGIYHSHTNRDSNPSLADLSSCEATGLPWHIVDMNGGYTRIEPSGFRAPLLRRPYVHGVHDCYSAVRDWFNWEWDLGLPDVDRDSLWWEKGQNLYLDNFEKYGFVRLIDQPAQIGDAFLIQMESKVPNHSAVYIGEGMIFHHVRGRLSCREPWGGFWLRHMTHHLRHTSRMGSTNG